MQGGLRKVPSRLPPTVTIAQMHYTASQGMGIRIDFIRDISKSRISKRKDDMSASHAPRHTRVCVLG